MNATMVFRRRPSRLMSALLLAVGASACATAQVPARTGASGSASSSVLSSAPAPAPARGTTLTLLGTGGGPGGLVDRAGIASLLTVDGTNYLIDAGEGVTRELARAGVPETAVSTVFLTHLHDDHTAGLPALATFAYTLRSKGLAVIGPMSTKRLTDGILAYMQPNADIRRAERRLPDPATIISGRDVGPGPVFADAKVTVTAAENTHFTASTRDKAAARSLAYRFQTPDKVVVFTGDTGPSDAVDALANGADILVCEVVGSADIASVPVDVRVHMLEEHLSAAEAGKLATRAGVKTLVLSHLRTMTPADLAEVKRHFAGRVLIGADLQRF
ncbi:MBL fold metallo-hydrolase [Sphingomonas sp. LB3N6]|uniref:MBL fold metallo-hydrolase n=1 Tax=Sphingomonas fucosidasi TaxID=3096164 RepID=UPI002FC860F2